VWCDHQNDGGGWTLIARIQNINDAVWYYASSMWTSATETRSEDDIGATPDTDAHYKSSLYGSLPVTAIRFHMGERSGPAHTQVVALNTSSAHAAFTAGDSVTAGFATRDEWFGFHGEPSSVWAGQPNCNARGLPIGPVNGQVYRLGCRFGLLMNNENDCVSPNSFIGFGCQDHDTLDAETPSIGCGGMTWWPERVYPKQGWIWVR
jgi:hypothetical protein